MKPYSLINWHVNQQVHSFISEVNKTTTDIRDDNYNWSPRFVQGLGPSRPYYFLPEEVVRGSIKDGFHRNEKPLHATAKKEGNDPYLEYPGYTCGNRKFRVSFFKDLQK